MYFGIPDLPGEQQPELSPGGMSTGSRRPLPYREAVEAMERKLMGGNGARLRERRCSPDLGQGGSHTRRESHLARTKIASMPRILVRVLKVA
jgi:hypothetical protein